MFIFRCFVIGELQPLWYGDSSNTEHPVSIYVVFFVVPLGFENFTAMLSSERNRTFKNGKPFPLPASIPSVGMLVQTN